MSLICIFYITRHIVANMILTHKGKYHFTFRVNNQRLIWKKNKMNVRRFLCSNVSSFHIHLFHIKRLYIICRDKFFNELHDIRLFSNRIFGSVNLFRQITRHSCIIISLRNLKICNDLYRNHR